MPAIVELILLVAVILVIGWFTLTYLPIPAGPIRVLVGLAFVALALLVLFSYTGWVHWGSWGARH
ncbi:MAG TPA: hypothetical protein VK607_10455 [Kofleriaceae bacterium]|nr:hypothetical protein [Kofleriaceae bacterium]